MECQERYKAYAVTKRAKRRALKGMSNNGADSGGSLLHDGLESLHRDDMSGHEDDAEMSPPGDDGYDPELMNLDGDIPIDPAIHGPDSIPSKDTNVRIDVSSVWPHLTDNYVTRLSKLHQQDRPNRLLPLSSLKNRPIYPPQPYPH